MCHSRLPSDCTSTLTAHQSLHLRLSVWLLISTMRYAPKTGQFRVIKVLPTKTTIDEDGIRNTVIISSTTLAPLTKFAERPIVYMTSEPVDNRGDDVNTGKGQTTEEEFDAAWREHAVDHIVRHVGGGDTFDALCAGTATNQWTNWAFRRGTFPDTSLLALGVEWRELRQCNHNVDRLRTNENGRYQSNQHLLDDSSVEEKISNSRQQFVKWHYSTSKKVEVNWWLGMICRKLSGSSIYTNW